MVCFVCFSFLFLFHSVPLQCNRMEAWRELNEKKRETQNHSLCCRTKSAKKWNHASVPFTSFFTLHYISFLWAFTYSIKTFQKSYHVILVVSLCSFFSLGSFVMEWVKDERMKHEITQVKERKQHTTHFFFLCSSFNFTRHLVNWKGTRGRREKEWCVFCWIKVKWTKHALHLSLFFSLLIQIKHTLHSF